MHSAQDIMPNAPANASARNARGDTILAGTEALAAEKKQEVSPNGRHASTRHLRLLAGGDELTQSDRGRELLMFQLGASHR